MVSTWNTTAMVELFPAIPTSLEPSLQVVSVLKIHSYIETLPQSKQNTTQPDITILPRPSYSPVFHQRIFLSLYKAFHL